MFELLGRKRRRNKRRDTITQEQRAEAEAQWDLVLQHATDQERGNIRRWSDSLGGGRKIRRLATVILSRIEAK